MKTIKQKLKKSITISFLSVIMILLPFNQAFSKKICNKHIKGTVWFDINGDGVYTNSSENGIEGIKVELYKDNNIVGSDYTGVNGNYQINYPCAGNYTIKCSDPSLPDEFVATTTYPITINANGNSNYNNKNIGFWDNPNNCPIIKPNGRGYFTTISSVENNGSDYTIELTVEYNGAPDPNNKELSYYSVEAAQGTYSNVSVQVISGSMTNTGIDYGWTLSNTSLKGFQIKGISGIGNETAGVFKVTYTISSLQDERTDAKVNGNQISAFTASEFQQVLDCMAPVNNPPVAVDDNYTTPFNTPKSGNVITNDSDPDQDNITVTNVTTNPTHGSVVQNADGTFTYTPTTGYTGTDFYVYKICDDGTPSLCDEATVTITIQAPANNPPVAIDDNYTTPLNTPKSGNVITNDSDPDQDNITVTNVTTNPAHGSVVQNADGTFTYTPTTGYTGTDFYVYKICDDGTPSLCDEATVTITINAPGNNPPVAVDDTYSTDMNTAVSGNVITNDSDPDNDNITVNTTLINDPTHGSVVQNADGTFTYTPNTGYTGTDSYVYKICDDGTPSLCDEATVTINIAYIHNHYPATGYGTLAYEDLWPGKGDYDFNDLVCDYRFEMITNESNKVVKIIGTFIIKAFGASLQNGFGFQLPNDNVANSDITVTGYDIQESYINLNANGTEAGQSKPTIIVFDNAFDIMPSPGQGTGVNTTPSAPYVEPDTLVITMNFTQNTYTLAQIDIPNFNPFIIIDMNRGMEVHLPDYPPTDLIDESYFGTEEDDSNVATGKYYKTENNLPWAINIYESFDYPKEKVDIINTYNHFVEWAESNGSSYSDWYKDKSGYRNANNIYQIPSK
ncbi:MAG: LruC domain-containing protein [Bacteroidales bacterium]|nr:LruC domain-containing protein [Bacteroidales bacterium]